MVSVTTDLRLRPLRSADELAARQAHVEMVPDGFVFLLDWRPTEGWERYLQRLEDARRGFDQPGGRASATFLVADVAGELVGRVSIRHALNEALLNVGGHIGYGVRPGYRRRGFASEILGQALTVARAEGIDRILITCDEDNLASIKVIERHDGQLEDTRPIPGAAAKRRYWID